VLGHVGENAETAFWVVEVPVLDTGLDNVQRGGDDERCRSTCNRGDEVLEPGCGVVVGQLEEIFFGGGRTAE